MIEQVYNRYYNTAGNYHWIGVHSGEHIVRKGEKMTKDEAIFELGYAKDFQTPKRKEAIDMAIEALSTERTGHWIEGQTAGQKFVKCSRCGHIEFDGTPNYCEDCGARMVNEE